MTLHYYVIQHVKTGQLMPEMKKGRGYTHWNPDTESTPFASIPTPRLFTDVKKARRSIVSWATQPNLEYKGHTTYDGEEDYGLDIKLDGRKREDLVVRKVAFKIY